MKFDEQFFEGEEREGFYITPLMKRAWAAQLEVLHQIDDICKRNDIEYFAHGGTLLGAIRHGGFIPWDDDIDIEMGRLDYERFLKIAENELPREYVIMNAATDSEWEGYFSRVINTEKIPLKGERLREFHGFPFCVGVDIFPIDYLPLDSSEEEAMLILYNAAYTLAYDWGKEEMTEEEKIYSLQEVGKYCNYEFTQDKPYRQQLWILADRIAAMYWDMGATAKEAAVIYEIARSSNARIPLSWYAETKRVPFENTTIPVQGACNQILTVYYGKDYMIPKKGAANHDYPFYKEQLQIWMKDMEEKEDNNRSEIKSLSTDLTECMTDEKTGCVLPREWMDKVYADGRRKKILLYHTSADSLICQEKLVDDKLRYVFDLCRENQEILLWWLPGNFIKTNLSYVNEMAPQLMQCYEKLEKEFVNHNFGIYDVSRDINRAVAMADAYFGDEGEVLELFKESGKPIMIQNYEIAE